MLCDRLDIDLYEAIRQKLEANRRKYPADPDDRPHTKDPEQTQ